jgi:hypothetical protein
MAIDINAENVMTLAEAASALPRLNGRKLHISTLWRWARVGCKGVKLDYTRLGHRILVSREGCARFMAALAKAEPVPRPRVPDPQPATRTPERKAKDIAKARAELAELGV